MSPTLKGTFFALIALSIIFFIIERVIGKARGPLIRKGWLTDVSYLFVTPLVSKSLSLAAIILPLGLLIWCGVASRESLQARTYAGFGPLSTQPLWLQAVEIYLLADLVSYWSHRLFHRGRWWPFHAVHHSSEDLDWLSSVRVHPVNELVTKALQVTPLLLLGFNPAVTLSFAPFLTFYAIFIHAKLDWDFGPLRFVVATPMFHRWHHSRQPEAIDKNFAGLLPIWDILFGTFYMPRGKVPEDFGIMEPIPNHLPGQLWQPIRGLWK
jgi:sterol desaturase/sphingolipid hydroxylase (fatty acid hydroxylase superfamily)